MAEPDEQPTAPTWIERARDLAWTQRRLVLGGAGALCVGLVGASVVVVALDAKKTVAPVSGAPPAAALGPVPGCPSRAESGTANPAPADAGTNERVSARLGSAPLSEVLRGAGIAPPEVYRVRRALESIPGFVGIDEGRFVATLAAGVVTAFEVRTTGWTYRAATSAGSELVAERTTAVPPVRLCSGAFALRGSLEESLTASGFAPDLAPALRAALAGRVELAGLPPETELRVIPREVEALGGFGGYDGLAAVEVRPKGGAPTRIYGVRGEVEPSYLDAEGQARPAPAPQPTEAMRATWRDHKPALDAALDAAVRASPAPTPVSPVIGAPGDTTGDDPVGDTDLDVREEDPAVRADPSRTVAQAAEVTCSTRIVAGLSKQIIAEGRCLDEGAFARIPPRKNLRASSDVFMFLEAPARDRLLQVLAANPTRTLTINSALRTVAQQVLLSKWGEKKRCGVKLAASPSESNHESGLAIDVRDAPSWRKALEAQGFKWMGRKDPVHFDYAGPGAIDHRGLDVRAFQRLWNRNHPDDAVGVTGKLDEGTKRKLLSSPASGFPLGARCAE